MSHEFISIIQSIQTAVGIVSGKVDDLLEILQGKLKDRKDSGLCGDVDKNTYWRKRYGEREKDIDKNIVAREEYKTRQANIDLNTQFRLGRENDRNTNRYISIGAFVTLIGKIVYDWWTM